MTASEQDRRSQIRQLNDRLRITGMGGSVMLTAGLAALPDAVLSAVLVAVSQFEAFTADNDPYGEHDCASLNIGDEAIIWKIDYFNLNLAGQSIDPAVANVTRRVLTISKCSEY